jgi:hypothetical protein
VTEKAVQSILAVQSTFFDMSLSTTAGRLHYSELELSCADATTSAAGTASGSPQWNTFKKITNR